MERRSPYVLIGAAMILFIAAVGGFVVWKLRAGDRTAYYYYDILFSGEVQGLTIDSPVFYRGIRVGRVSDIKLDKAVGVQRSTGRERLNELVRVTVAVSADFQIPERSYAVLEKSFITNSAVIQIVGRLDVDKAKDQKKLGDKPYPEIREGASFFQQLQPSAQELISKAGVTVDRLNELLNPDNIHAVADALRNIQTVTAGLAKQDGAIQATLAELPVAIAEFRKIFDKVNGLTDSLSLLAMELGPQDAATKKALEGKQPSELSKTIAEARAALGEARSALHNVDGAASQLSKLVGDSKGPIKNFSEVGLNELSLTIRELRQLTTNLNVIATRLERDPAGFVFSGKQGYTPK